MSRPSSKNTCEVVEVVGRNERQQPDEDRRTKSSDAKMRSKLIQPILFQDSVVAELNRRRRSVVDINPEMGLDDGPSTPSEPEGPA